jgi:hypothetical protein
VEAARRSAIFTALRNSIMWSAACSASVASNTASTWLGPISAFERLQRQPERL